MKSKRTRTGFAMVYAGLFLFFNPVVSLYDFLPDVLGALLIFLGLKKSAAIDGHFDDARRSAFNLIWLYLLKLVMSFTLLGSSDNSLPYTFMASVLEIVFLLPFFSKLYEGFEYTSMRMGTGNTAKAVKDARTFSAIFVVAKCVLTFMPEVLVFMEQNEEMDLSANASYSMPVIHLKPYVILFSVIVQLILGIIYLYQTGKFLKIIKKDSLYMQNFSSRCAEEWDDNHKAHAYQAIGASCLFLIASQVFLADFYIQGADILPDILAGVMLIISFACVWRFTGNKKPSKTPVIVFLISTLCFTILSYIVQPQHYALLTGTAVDSLPFTGALSVSTASMTVVSVVFCVISFISALWVYKAWIDCHNGVYALNDTGNHDRKLISVYITAALAVLVKYISFAVDVSASRLACIPEVSVYIASRTRMTQSAYELAVESSSNIALFENLDSISTVLRLAALVLIVFSVFNIFALKAQAISEEE